MMAIRTHTTGPVWEREFSLKIGNELDVFHAAMAWMAYELGPRRRCVERLVRHVRFTCMTPAELIAATQVNTFIRYSSFCRNRVLEAVWLMTLKGYQTYDVFDCACPKTRCCLAGRGPQPHIDVETILVDRVRNNSNPLPPSAGHYAASVSYQNCGPTGGLPKPVPRPARPEESPPFSPQQQRTHDPSSDRLSHLVHDADDATFNNPNKRPTGADHRAPSCTSLGMKLLHQAHPEARDNFCQSSGGELPSPGSGGRQDAMRGRRSARGLPSSSPWLVRHLPDPPPGVSGVGRSSSYLGRRHQPSADMAHRLPGSDERLQSSLPDGGPGGVQIGYRPHAGSVRNFPSPFVKPGSLAATHRLNCPSVAFSPPVVSLRPRVGHTNTRRGSTGVPAIGRPGSSVSKSVTPVRTQREANTPVRNTSFNSAASDGSLNVDKRPSFRSSEQSGDGRKRSHLAYALRQAHRPNMEHGTSNRGPWNMEHGTSNRGPWNMEQRQQFPPIPSEDGSQEFLASGTTLLRKVPSFTTYGHPPTRSPYPTGQMSLNPPPPPPPPPPTTTTTTTPPPPPKEFEEVPMITIYSSRFDGRFQGETTGIEVNFQRREVSPSGGEQSSPGDVGTAEGDLLAVGGFVDSNNRLESSQAQRLASGEQKWEKLSEIPETRLNFTAAFLNNKICVCGGYDPDHSKTKATTDTFLYDLELRKWDRGGPMLYARAFHAVCVLGGRLYVVGGQDQEERSLKTTEVYDPEADRWSLMGSMTSCRVGACAAAFQGRLLAVGGYGVFSASPQAHCPVLSSTEWFEPEINRWHSGSSLRLPRAQACLVAVDPHLYLCGGASRRPSTGALCSIPDVDQYNSDTDQWTHLTALNTARHNAGANAIGSKIYVVGGVSTDMNKVLRSVECYDTAAGKWGAALPALPLGAKSVACIVLCL